MTLQRHGFFLWWHRALESDLFACLGTALDYVFSLLLGLISTHIHSTLPPADSSQILVQCHQVMYWNDFLLLLGLMNESTNEMECWLFAVVLPD
jgi:hypothetical protein